MARARFIRPEFFTDEKLSEASFGARLLFAAIWTHSDLRGVFEYSAKQLRVQAFPHDEGMTSAQVLEWLKGLERLGMIFRFEAEGKSWGVVRNWAKHQHISKREIESGSSRPLPPEITPTPSQHHPNTMLAECQSASPSPSPTLSPTPSPTYRAHDPEDDIGTPGPAKPIHPPQRWSYEMNEPWARSLKKIGLKFGVDTWERVFSLVEKHGLPACEVAAQAVVSAKPMAAWGDALAAELEQSRGQTPIGQAIKSKIIKVDTHG